MLHEETHRDQAIQGEPTVPAQPAPSQDAVSTTDAGPNATSVTSGTVEDAPATTESELGGQGQAVLADGLDLDAIEADLADIETSMNRLRGESPST